MEETLDLQEIDKFDFVHTKTPCWASAEDVYFSVRYKDLEIGYIGLQSINFKTGLCDNICYKTNTKFRDCGLTKRYFKQFIEESCPFIFDEIKATVLSTNVASEKILKNAGFELYDKIKNKHFYRLRKLDY